MAVADRQVGRGQASPSVQPMEGIGRIVRPEYERNAGCARTGTENRLRPRHVAYHDVDRALVEQFRKPAPCAQHRKWMPDTDLAQHMNRRAGGRQLIAQAAVETKGKLRFDFGHSRRHRAIVTSAVSTPP